jgi:predicted transcriptional regulator
MPPVPPEAQAILAELKHHSRLPILMALEKHPRTAKQLCTDLGLDMDGVQHALRLLGRSGLVAEVDAVATTYNLTAIVYCTPLRGWSTILEAASAVADSRSGPHGRA